MMVSFLKYCLAGFLAIVLSPLWVTFFALMIVFLFISFLLMAIRVLYYDIRNFFVRDKNKIFDPLGDLDEDYEVKRIIAAREKASVEIISPEKKDIKPIEVTEYKESNEEKKDVNHIELATSLDIKDGGEE